MKIDFKSSFLKAIKKIDNDQLKMSILQVINNVESANNLKEIDNLKKLTGYKNYFRIKIGMYRIGVKIENEIVVVAAFAHRKDIYRIFP